MTSSKPLIENSNHNEELFDLIIIGGGPTGLFSAFYAGMRQLKVKVIESMPQLGGQLSALYPEKYIYDVAGYPKIKAQELVENLKEQMLQFNPVVVLNQSVAAVEKNAKNFILTSNTGVKHRSKAIVITAGVGAFQPRRLNVADAGSYENKNIHYFVKDINQFEDKKVGVCGGGDSAFDWALTLEPIAKEVSIIHFQDKFTAHEYSVTQVMKSRINLKTPYYIKQVIEGERDNINSILLENRKNNEKELLEVDELIVNYGFVSSIGPIKEWNLNLDKNKILVNSHMETSIEGIYAAGDIATYPGKVKLIATGFGEAPIAVNNAKKYIDPTSKVQPLHSTSVMA